MYCRRGFNQLEVVDMLLVRDGAVCFHNSQTGVAIFSCFLALEARVARQKFGRARHYFCLESEVSRFTSRTRSTRVRYGLLYGGWYEASDPTVFAISMQAVPACVGR